jgi:hypothetical protein
VHQAFRESQPSSLVIHDGDIAKGKLSGLEAANKMLEDQVESLQGEFLMSNVSMA